MILVKKLHCVDNDYKLQYRNMMHFRYLMKNYQSISVKNLLFYNCFHSKSNCMFF